MRSNDFVRASALATALALTATTTVARADDEPPKGASERAAPPRNVVLADLGLHVIGLGYQRTIDGWVALQADVDWYVPWTQTEETTGTMGGVLRLRPVFYVTDDAPEGLWLSPFVQGGFAAADRGATSKVGPAAAFGASVGYAVLVADHLHLSAGAGLQVHGVRIPGGTGEPSFFGAFPHLDGTVGYAF